MTTGLKISTLAMAWLALGAATEDDAAPFLGQWALSPDSGGAGWLDVVQRDGYLDGTLLWIGGSVVPASSTYVAEGALTVTRLYNVERKDSSGKVVRTHTFTETFHLEPAADGLRGTRIAPNTNGMGTQIQRFTARREPPMPPAPDLSAVRYGEPINLLGTGDLSQWMPLDPNAQSGWRVENGMLVNEAPQPEGRPHISYANLRTVDVFEDFNLKLEVRVPQNGNSGVYLRGIYEVQVADSYGSTPDTGTMGAIYSRIAPSAAAEKPAGAWQTLDITLVDRHITVKLNGTTLIDNQPLEGCTGGALWSDVLRPGPIYLQGDHTSVSYRNIVLTPVLSGGR